MSAPVPGDAPGLDEAAVRARCEAATPGPWFIVGPPWRVSSEIGTYVVAGNEDPHVGKPVLDSFDIDEWDAEDDGPDWTQSDIDLDFAAHARTDVPALLDALARLRGERERLRTALLDLANAAKSINAGFDPFKSMSCVCSPKVKHLASYIDREKNGLCSTCRHRRLKTREMNARAALGDGDARGSEATSRSST